MAHTGSMTIPPKVLYTAAAVAVLISLLAWAIEWSGLAYVCPYCRVQRTVIGLLGVLLLFARPGGIVVPWLAYTSGGFAFVVAAMQHFNGWKRISAGSFSLNEQWYIDPWLLSGGAMLMLVALMMLVQAACRRT
ncbi:hypothetical protein C1924_17545 [Stenotrophomonas sp. ESTM1D_MKCIP4_1]|uniref:hypothetical protein n=1 Tax=Stenotrophomonas sp. ESTM1D_MKCIP4_1 TaxID=2072414 RepID=UPI000D53D34D|nr:hypothetical protein [Stenotrophomonas sp. ESTM1D_MKCIP4_1]AWH54856.1 hypothetical protein C1924_17545 [Stenotrophomonas sp. ESTM1D_MKCIP4_1]